IAVKVWNEAGQFHVSVADSGIGIAPENLPVLFERFRRIEGSRSRTHEGSGIGLALVQELARLHGGRVEVASEVGRGTTFTVTIPQGNAHLPAEHVQAICIPPRATAGAHAFVQEALAWSREAAASAPDVDGDRAGRRRIVLADDNADMRDYLRKLLATRYDVEAVSDGAAALEACRRRMPDLVVSDLMMPRLDGMQLVHALRSGLGTRHVPVILLSARADEDSRIEALNAGAQDYLFKPFRAHELLARVAVRLEMGSLESVLERQRSALLAVFAESPVPIAVMSGENLVFELANPAYEATVGRGNLLGRELLDALPEMRGQGFDELLRQVLRTGRPLAGKERPATIHRDGKAHEIFYDFVYSPLRDLAGRTIGVISVAQDVTAQVHSRHAFQEAARNKDQFIAMMAHELRNPLAPIRNAVELLKIAGDDPARRKLAVAIMDRQVRYSSRLVDDLLDMSRIAQGKLLIRRQGTTLANIIESAVETAGPFVDASGQRLAVHAPPDRVALHADPVRISQVVANLLGNAAKFGRRGDTVAIEAAVRGNWVEIAVSDQGIGIEPGDLHAIFDMFTQVSGRREAGGLGIGLTLARKLVELHGGTLDACSEGLGKGSRFTVRLPCNAAAHAERSPRRAESAP
ncbi:MAG TPA: ATP-binding protein, partial [Usitatibacter sp.]|nr:ATP-binding protein [Usitatibacter sp.]